MNPLLHPAHPASPLHPRGVAALPTLEDFVVVGLILAVLTALMVWTLRRPVRARVLALLLALALPASAQQFGVGGQVVSGGVTQQWFGYGKPNGTSGPGVYMTPPKGLVGWWDFGAGDSLVWGGKDSAGTDDFADNDSATPVTENSYPIVVWGWGMADAIGGASQCLLQFGDATGSESFSVAVSVTGYLRAMSTDGGVAVEADSAAGAIVTNVRFRYIAVFESTTSRSIYVSSDLTGATETTSSAPSGIDRVRFFGWRDGTTDWAGNAGPTHVFANATVPSSDQRTAFLRDCHDPEVIMGARATALWMVGDTTSLTDQRGSVNLSVDGNSVVDATVFWAARDQSGQNNALIQSKALGAASQATVVTTALNGRTQLDTGATTGAVRTSTGRTPVTAAPIQLYAVVDQDVSENGDVAFQVGDDAGTTHRFCINQNATPAYCMTTSDAGGLQQGVSSLTWSINTGYLVWGGELSATDRRIEVNGANGGTNTTSRTPSGIDHVSVMGYAGNSPSSGMNGQMALAVILNTSSIAGQPSIERFTSAAYALGF